MCEGVDLLKQWKQGNTCFGRTIKDPIIRGLFFCKFFAANYFHFVPRISYKKFDSGQNELLSKYFLFGYLISSVGNDVFCPLRF
jgi:hypothetical protein